MWVTCFDTIDIEGLKKMYVLKQVTSKNTVYSIDKNSLHWENSSLGLFVLFFERMKECHYIDSLAHEKDEEEFRHTIVANTRT